MSESRTKLAKMTGDELAGDVDVIVKESGAPVHDAPGIDPTKMDGNVPSLSEAVRALLIMAGCEVTFGGNHWVVRKTKISVVEEQAWAMATLQNRRKIRFQTGLPLNASFEDWRKALFDLTGELPKP